MRLSVTKTAKICPIEIAANISACVTGKPAQLHDRPYSPKLQPALPHLLRFSPPRLGSSRNSSSSGSAHFPLGFLNCFALCRHPLSNPGSNVGKSGSTDFALLLGRFSCGNFTTTAQELTKFLLQRLDSLLDVGCSTELCWCYVYHVGRSVAGFGVVVKQPNEEQKCFTPFRQFDSVGT